MRRYFATLFVFAASASMAFAQIESADDDFGIDVSIGAEKELVPDLELSVEANMRTQDNTERLERYVIGGELSYKFLNTKKFDMKVSGGFEYTNAFNSGLRVIENGDFSPKFEKYPYYGEEATKDTLDLLDSIGMKHIGAGKNIDEAYNAVVLEKDGVTVSVISVCENEFGIAQDNKTGSAGFNLTRVIDTIKNAKEKAEITIV